MNRVEVFNKIVGIISPFCKNAEALKSVSEGSRFIEELQINSARLVDIILSVEDDFGLEIDDEVADKLRTVGDVVNFVVSKN